MASAPYGVRTGAPVAAAPALSLPLALAFGLLLFNRIDQLPLVAPLIAYALWRDGRDGRLHAAALRLAVGLAPLVLWLLFAAFYYGFPLPNTSYAKVTDMTWAARLSAAQAYFADIARWEPALVLAVLALVAGIPLLIALPAAAERAATRGRRRWLACLVLGGALQILYIVSVGGDYMRGRFLTGLLLIALAALVVAAAAAAGRRRSLATALGAALPPSGACTLRVLVDARVAAQLRSTETGIYAATIDLPANASVIRLRIADAVGAGRYPFDPRSLMLFVGGVRAVRP